MNRGERIAKVGTVLSAVMASSCCWLPLLLLTVGVSGAGIAATLEAYRPAFIVVTFGFLAAAFYFTYRPRKSAATGDDCCAAERAEAADCCAPSPSGRFSMMAMHKVMLWGVTVLAVAFLLLPSYVGAPFGSANDTSVTENMNQAVFQIEGMSCEGCATALAESLREVTGVTSVHVDFQSSRAYIQNSACCTLPEGIVLSTIEKAGFRGHVQNSDSPQNPKGDQR